MSQPDYQTLAARTRRVMLASYGLLLLMLTVNTVIAPSCERDPNPTVWVLNLLPLLIFLPALLKNSLRGLAWMSFVLMGYFLLAVLGAFVCPSPWISVELAMIVSLFCATVMFIRWQARSLRAATSQESDR